jgi:hypothetical protein
MQSYIEVTETIELQAMWSWQASTANDPWFSGPRKQWLRVLQAISELT